MHNRILEPVLLLQTLFQTARFKYSISILLLLGTQSRDIYQTLTWGCLNIYTLMMQLDHLHVIGLHYSRSKGRHNPAISQSDPFSDIIQI